MSGPQTLARPLAQRVAGLPDPATPAAGPQAPPAVIEAAVEALGAGKTHYTDRPGILPLRAWVTRYLNARFGVEVAPDQVTITCGATEARFVAIKLLARPAAPIVCPGDPAPIVGAAHLVGARVAAQADDPAAVNLLYLTPHDAPEAVSVLLSQAALHGWWIAYDVSQPGGAPFHPAHNPALAARVITLGSLSDRLPGWRMGWMAGSEMAGRLRAYKQSMTICSTSISQWAALGLPEGL